MIVHLTKDLGHRSPEAGSSRVVGTFLVLRYVMRQPLDLNQLQGACDLGNGSVLAYLQKSFCFAHRSLLIQRKELTQIKCSRFACLRTLYCFLFTVIKTEDKPCGLQCLGTLFECLATSGRDYSNWISDDIINSIIAALSSCESEQVSLVLWPTDLST